MRHFEELMKYLARNAYIIVALNGTPLIESGKKAFRLLASNLLDVIALNRFGDFVLFVGKIFVTAISGLVCYSIIDVSFQSLYWHDSLTVDFFRVEFPSPTKLSPSSSASSSLT
jgi:hypothetical protein